MKLKIKIKKLNHHTSLALGVWFSSRAPTILSFWIISVSPCSITLIRVTRRIAIEVIVRNHYSIFTLLLFILSIKHVNMKSKKYFTFLTEQWWILLINNNDHNSSMQIIKKIMNFLSKFITKSVTYLWVSFHSRQ